MKTRTALKFVTNYLSIISNYKWIPQIYVWKDQNNLRELPQISPSFVSLYLFAVWVFNLLTPLSDQDRIYQDNIVINTISTRHVIRMGKNVNTGITC